MATKNDRTDAEHTVPDKRAQFFCSLSSTLLRTDRNGGSGSQIVAMMQPTEPWHTDNSVARVRDLFCHSASWRLFPQSKMRPILVIIADVFSHQPLEMTFVQDDHMVEQVSAAVSHPAFCDTVLPRASETGSLREGLIKSASIPSAAKEAAEKVILEADDEGPGAKAP